MKQNNNIITAAELLRIALSKAGTHTELERVSKVSRATQWRIQRGDITKRHYGITMKRLTAYILKGNNNE